MAMRMFIVLMYYTFCFFGFFAYWMLTSAPNYCRIIVWIWIWTPCGGGGITETTSRQMLCHKSKDILNASNQTNLKFNHP